MNVNVKYPTERTKTVAKRRFVALGLLGSAALLTLPARDADAGHSAYLRAQTESSMRAALDARELPILKVTKPAEGPQARLGRLLGTVADLPGGKELAGRASRTRRSKGRVTMTTADGGARLVVLGDGSSFRFRGRLSEASGPGAPGGLAEDVVEQLGRAYVDARLAPFLPMGEGEKLVFLGTKVMREGSFSAAEPAPTSRVVANIALFGREVGGTFVAGPGSKVAVWLSSQGTPFGFDVDWPIYQTTPRSQATLPIDGVWARFERYADSSLETLRENLGRFECGYVDLGIKKRARRLQAGCAAHHDGALSQGLRYAAVDVVPIGEPVLSDGRWPLTKSVKKGAEWDLCKALRGACKAGADAPAGGVALPEGFDPENPEGLVDVAEAPATPPGVPEVD